MTKQNTTKKNDKAQSNEDLDLTALMEDVKKTDPKEVLIISTDSAGRMVFNTNIPSYRTILYLLSRANLEVLLHEMTAMQRANEETSAKAA